MRQTSEHSGHGRREFHIQRCIGRGGFGEVYLATMVGTGGLRTDVAVKVLHESVGRTNEAVRRLRDEGRMLAQLRHPAILRVHDLALLRGRVGLVTEYVPGLDLAEAIAKGSNRIAPRALVEVIGIVAEALDAAYNSAPSSGHPLRIVHRDVKPSNIRLGPHGAVKLLDFGVAWAEDAERVHTTDNKTFGSLAYMAPECFKRGRPGPAADMYALGCCLFEGFAGEPLYIDPSPVESFQRAADPEVHDDHVARRFGLLPADLRADIGFLIGEMLAYEADQRPAATLVASKCDAFIETMAGLTLKRWARSFEPHEVSIQAPWIGQVLTDGNNAQGNAPVQTTAPQGSTFPIDLPKRRTPPGKLVANALPSSFQDDDEPTAHFAAETTFAPIDERDMAPAKPSVKLAAARAGARAVAKEDDGGPSWFLVGAMTLVTFVLFAVCLLIMFGPQSPVAGYLSGPAAPLGGGNQTETLIRPNAPVRTSNRGMVSVSTPGIPIQLRSPDGNYGAGSVPEGQYRLFANFGFGWVYQGNAWIVPESYVSIRCDADAQRCDIND
jgi:serine/threonine protein kinase